MCQRNHAFTYVYLSSYVYAIFLPQLSLLPTYMHNMLILPAYIQSMLILLVSNSSDGCHHTFRRHRFGLWPFVLLTHVPHHSYHCLQPWLHLFLVCVLEIQTFTVFSITSHAKAYQLTNRWYTFLLYYFASSWRLHFLHKEQVLVWEEWSTQVLGEKCVFVH